jgi:DNA-binding transcriptional MerR regulator
MKKDSISKIARQYGLSRSTLLYYDRIGLLPPSGRTASGYRYYSDKDHKRLERICFYRQAGLSLEDIREILFSRRKPLAKVFESRLRELGEEVRDLKNKQRLLTGMLKSLASGGSPVKVDKAMWVEMLRAAGMDDEAMSRWHAEFEQRAPEEHHEFLLTLGIPEKEVREIRKWSLARM